MEVRSIPSYAVYKGNHEGNEKYRNFDVDELTERDMETILSYAGSKGVEIIPLINTPGHMDSILNAATSLTGVNCAYSSSARTIDVTNSTATAFTQALLQKYISWFASKGCTMFNMGADEYANDTGNPRFSELISSGAYSSYITYLNTVAGMIENAGMTPRHLMMVFIIISKLAMELLIKIFLYVIGLLAGADMMLHLQVG